METEEIITYCLESGKIDRVVSRVKNPRNTPFPVLHGMYRNFSSHQGRYKILTYKLNVRNGLNIKFNYGN
jgi:hypothetical protein